jgi:hypothetical protein
MRRISLLSAAGRHLGRTLPNHLTLCWLEGSNARGGRWWSHLFFSLQHFNGKMFFSRFDDA